MFIPLTGALAAISRADWLVLAAVSGILSGGPPPAADPGAYIRALFPEERLAFIVKYAASADVYSGLLKFRRPPRIFIRCPDDGCEPDVRHLPADLRARVPAAYGEEVDRPEAAEIEIHVAAGPRDFDRRDREVDGMLHVDAQLGSRYLFPPQPAPCRATLYFDQQRWTMVKSMIFVDSGASPRMQYLCMAFELVRAIGVLTVPAPLFYRELEKHPGDDPLPRLAADAYLHTSMEIAAGASRAQALAVLKHRYDLQ
ncbi:MAG: hypothetical protein AB7S92_14385 [Parvibaculaceae bacterium]